MTRGGAGSGASGTNETRKGTGGLSSSSKGASVRCWSETFRQEAKEKAETQQILDILAALDYYEQLKSAVELKLLRVPFSPGAKAYPAPPAWERAIQRIMQQEIDATLAELLPIFDHGMEKAPLKAFDRYLKESRRSVNQS